MQKCFWNLYIVFFFFPTVSILHELFIVTSKNPSKFVFFNCELQEVKKKIGSNWTEKIIKMIYLNLVIVLKIAFYFYYFFIFLVSTYERENTLFVFLGLDYFTRYHLVSSVLLQMKGSVLGDWMESIFSLPIYLLIDI